MSSTAANHWKNAARCSVVLKHSKHKYKDLHGESSIGHHLLSDRREEHQLCSLRAGALELSEGLSENHRLYNATPQPSGSSTDHPSIVRDTSMDKLSSLSISRTLFRSDLGQLFVHNLLENFRDVSILRFASRSSTLPKPTVLR